MMYLLRCTSGVETPRPCVLLYFVLSALTTTSKRLQVWQSFALFLCAVVVVVAIAWRFLFLFFPPRGRPAMVVVAVRRVALWTRDVRAGNLALARGLFIQSRELFLPALWLLLPLLLMMMLASLLQVCPCCCCCWCDCTVVFVVIAGSHFLYKPHAQTPAPLVNRDKYYSPPLKLACARRGKIYDTWGKHVLQMPHPRSPPSGI